MALLQDPMTPPRILSTSNLLEMCWRVLGREVASRAKPKPLFFRTRRDHEWSSGITRSETGMNKDQISSKPRPGPPCVALMLAVNPALQAAGCALRGPSVGRSEGSARHGTKEEPRRGVQSQPDSNGTLSASPSRGCKDCSSSVLVLPDRAGAGGTQGVRRRVFLRGSADLPAHWSHRLFNCSYRRRSTDTADDRLCG